MLRKYITCLIFTCAGGGRMKVITGDETGLIKVSDCKTSKVLRKMGEQSKEEGIQCMCWGGGENPEEIVVAGAASGIVNVWDVEKAARRAQFDPLSPAHAKPVSVKVLRKGAGSASPLMITACENGAMSMRKMNEALTEVESEEDLTLKGPISRIAVSPLEDHLAYGGKENEAQVYDIETGKVTWTARNVGNNFLDLRMPVWVTDLAYLPGEDQRKIAVCTAYGQVRLYDIRAQRRPVVDARVTEVSEQIRLEDGTRLTSISICPTEPTWCVVGDATGGVRKVDLVTGNVFGKFKFISGSVRGVDLHSTQPYMATASLDRYMRVYDCRSMGVLSSVYTKQRLTCLLFSSETIKQTKKIGRVDLVRKKKRVEGEEGDDDEDGSGDDEDEDEDGNWLGMKKAKTTNYMEQKAAKAQAEEEGEGGMGGKTKDLSRKGKGVQKPKVASSKKVKLAATKKKGGGSGGKKKKK